MTYGPTSGAGEEPSLRTYHSRSLVRGMLLLGVVAMIVGAAMVVFSTGTLGPILLPSGGVLALGCLVAEIGARRRPAPPTGEGNYAGPREAGW